ncbi:hypothetical protein [Thioalkalivibrio sp. ALJ24]|uniref:hypothetical protein n=1 Tax=Thioalkalivibrio sp. ALJ24 TaxID=545276 RepID=UPI000365C827|nr:hypothetical protein [Thioalkalivibrio sp. ALJ24]
MEKSDFQVDGHYAVTMKDEQGKLRPANIYVHRMEDDHMIVRYTSGGDVGLLFKLKYDDVVKIVRTHKVLDRKKFMVPDSVLDPKLWKDRDSMRAYSSAPGLGK